MQRIVIVGYGQLGKLVARHLSQAGYQVIIIEHTEGPSCEASGFIITGNATEIATLRRARLDQAGCLLALTGEDNLNLMVAQVARYVFHVPRVIACLCDPSWEGIYRRLKIEPFNPARLLTETLLAQLNPRSENGVL